MIAVSLSKLDRLTHRFQLFDLPFLFQDLQAVETFQAGASGVALLDSMKERGLLGLAFWHNGMKQFGGPVAMRSPKDAEGLKFRIMESDVLQEQILHIKGNPQKMAFAEVYQALQTGAVDAQENTWSNIYSSKFYEVQKYITQTNHGYLGYLIAVNDQYWSELPEDIRVELEAILVEVTKWGNESAKRINLEAKGKIAESSSTTIIELSDAERAVWQATMTPVWDKFEDTIGAEMIEAAQAVAQ
jgi:C4-dicarboxylate-binding protein DctP